MADQLYLSLWFPNFRLEALPSSLVAVMRQFALIASASGLPEGKRVSAASAYPISFSEAPSYQRLYVTDSRAEENQDTSASIIETAVTEATEHLHDDMAYEFEMKWNLWTPDSGPGSPNFSAGSIHQDHDIPDAQLDVLWKPSPATVKIIGFGPAFDEGDFQQNGHVRVDFGLDFPWVLDDDADPDDDDADPPDLDREQTPTSTSPSNVLAFNPHRSLGAPPSANIAEDQLSEAAKYIQKNVEMLLAFTLSVEKNCGISSRLLWTESGEPLAEKLIARLQRLH